MAANSGYSEYRPNRGEPVIQYQVADTQPQQYNLKTRQWQVPSEVSGKNQTSRSYLPIHAHHIFDVGIFRDTLAPSLALHSSFAVIAWGVGRKYDYVEIKDLLWPAGLVTNAWWSAIGDKVLMKGMPLGVVWRTLSWPERLILTGITAWGGRLFYRIASRALKRGTDDKRYAEIKKDEGFWNNALVSMFLPEALFQTIIALPFTAPFRHRGAVMTGYHPFLQSFSVGLFCTGAALEAIADFQLESHEKKEVTESRIQKEGAWSIVRHPNYLGDALMHAALPLLLFSSDMLAPIELLGPVANYIALRYVGGDIQREENQAMRYVKEDPAKLKELQEWRKEKNAFWPRIEEFKNEWTWYVIGAGVTGAVVERGVRALLH